MLQVEEGKKQPLTETCTQKKVEQGYHVVFGKGIIPLKPANLVSTTDTGQRYVFAKMLLS